MRHVATLLLLGFALDAASADIWRWTDANGVVHFSDNPMPGAERITVSAPAPSGSQPPPPAASTYTPPSATRAEPAGYTRCSVSAPANDETFHGVQPVSVQLDVQPALRPGHRIEVQVDGRPRADWPADSSTHTLPEVFRGSHTVQARILDASGVVLCSGPSITFHLRQQSVLPPAGRAPAPTPRPRPLPTTPGT